MADPPRNPDAGDNTRVEPDRGPRPGTSRWQKVVGIIGLLVLLWVGNRMSGTLLGRGHGGMRHGPRDEPPAEIQEHDTEPGDGHAPPPGFR